MQSSEAIATIVGREVFDSRGEPTVAATVTLRDKTSAVASVPSGASVGVHEACELRDGDARRFAGMGVRRAVRQVMGPICQAVAGMSALDQFALDERMRRADGTADKSRLGANAILAVSLAAARAAARHLRYPLYRYLRRAFFPRLRTFRLPRAMCNLVNGGIHGGWNLDFQEFLLLPQQRHPAAQLRCAAEVFWHLRALAGRRSNARLVGDEGGIAPALSGNEAALKLLSAAVSRAGYRAGTAVRFGLDVAASELYARGRYRLRREHAVFSSDQMVRWLKRLCARYPIATIEDGVAEDDWAGWQRITQQLPRSIRLVGDDIFTTSAERLRLGIAAGVANAVVIKPNQVGTLSETIETMRLAQDHGYQVVVSHRSGETNDDFIVDLAVAANAAYLKAGGVCRGERVAKWNRLMEIAEEIGY